MNAWTLGLSIILAIGCGGIAVVDGTAGRGGAGGVESEGRGAACPVGLVGDATPCTTVGQVCPGEGSDELCGDWTCTCVADGTFECLPGICQ